MQTEKQEKEVHVALETAGSNGLRLDHPTEASAIADTLKQLHYNHSYIGQVESFMTQFEQVIYTAPSFPPQQIMELRLALLLEEVSELAEACGKNVLSNFSVALLNKSQELHKKAEGSPNESTQGDITAAFDALLDTQYVLSGAVLAFGMQDKFDTGFEEVHRSNMSKACSSFQEAEATMDKYKGQGVECYIDVMKADKGIWLVKRSGDKKVLKSINYSPAELSKIVPDILKTNDTTNS